MAKAVPAAGLITLRRSLVFKLILAFWVVSILGIVLVALLAGRVSQLEFSRFIKESRYQGLIDDLSSYYEQNGSFVGGVSILESAQALQGAEAKEFLVVDPQGNVLLAKADHIPPEMPSPEFIRFGYPIYSNDSLVAYLIPMRPPRSPADSATENLRRINGNLFIGVIIATLIALLFGWFVARNITRPLRDLNSAAQEIARGNLENQVSITTRDEIGALAASFNQMITSLKRSRDLRRQMTADIAHELRNPLSIILGNAEALSEGVLPATPETLDIIYDEAKHLSRLVDDLRTLSLSESGELRLQRSLASPKEILDRCASAFAMRAAEKGLSMRVEVESEIPQLNVDVERILQVLANLLDNSLKHTPTGGSIVLAAKIGEKKTDDPAQVAVQLSVQDSGTGIQPEDLPNVFDRFYRGKQASGRIHDGSGLGLAISRALVEQLGGRIFVESQLGQGTKIIISLG